MNRRTFVKSSAILLGTTTVNMSGLSSLGQWADKLPDAERAPLLFIGHGSPMNAIEDNAYHKSWQELGTKLPKPKAILSISAHWITNGTTKVTAMDKPETIHDFGGFPQKLFDAQYPAPGAADMAKVTAELVGNPKIGLDHEWGLDHGTWSVLLPMYPMADIPVYQLSLDYNRPGQYHYDLGAQLAKLREKGVMIIGSGNIVHNLRALNFDNKNYDWAVEFDSKIAGYIEKRDHQSVIDFQKMGAIAKQAHPSYDHFLPLLYTLGLQAKDEVPTFFNASIDMGSVSMRSVLFNKA